MKTNIFRWYSLPNNKVKSVTKNVAATPLEPKNKIAHTHTHTYIYIYIY